MHETKINKKQMISKSDENRFGYSFFASIYFMIVDHCKPFATSPISIQFTTSSFMAYSQSFCSNTLDLIKNNYNFLNNSVFGICFVNRNCKSLTLATLI